MDRIWISYSKSESTEYCFLKYFFQMTGIWLMEYPETKEDKGAEMHLSILGRNEGNYIRPYDDGHVYLVRSSAVFWRFSDRKDIVEFEWRWSEKSFRELIKEIFKEPSECTVMEELLQIFMEEQFWGAAWLYHGITYKENYIWDFLIVTTCKKVRQKLQVSKYKDSWNHKFMEIYCDYMLYGVMAKSINERIERSEEMLQRCKDLSQERGWVSSLCMLAAKICDLSPIEEKFALSYYYSVERREVDSGVSYEIGHIYEKLYGEYERAIEYYKESLRRNRNNYRSMYKLAIHYNEKGEWMRALSLYERIRRETRKITGENSISVRGIEYEYKVLRQMIRLIWMNINDAALLKRFEDELKDLQDHLLDRRDFQNLSRCMFGEEHGREREREILREISKKISDNFVNN